jgi:hypothetical protein
MSVRKILSIEDEPISQPSFQLCIAMNLPLLNRNPQILYAALSKKRREERLYDVIARNSF